MKSIGLDVGYGWTKIVDEKGVRSYPSVVGSYEAGMAIEGFTDRLDDVETVEGQLFFVGDRAVRSSSMEFQARSRSWIESLPYRVLVSHALRPYDQPEPLHVVTGLPVGYLDDRKSLTKLIRQIHRGVKHISVLPQPLGSYMDLLLDEAGATRNPALADQTVGILDIGYYTTDCLIVDRLQPRTERMTGIEVGVSLVCQRLERDLREKFRCSWRLHQLDAALRSRSIKVRGTTHDIADLVSHRVKELTLTLQRYIEQLWQDATVDQLLLTGGGAQLVEAGLGKEYPVLAVQDPAIANARGYFKYGKQIQQVQ
ncbi:MAG: ParM/StbA family protein [Nitrospirota bacterium]